MADQSFCSVWKQMLSGKPYNALDPQLVELLVQTRERVRLYNDMSPSDSKSLTTFLKSLLGKCGDNVTINQPFRCDYGVNIEVGDNFFANFNFTILDEAKVIIGDNAFIGPNVSIYTACHPLDAATRNKGIEWAEAVMIGDNVWIGGSCTILPGVNIGDNCVIGAGSVVTRDIPPNCLAVGNPARVIRSI